MHVISKLGLVGDWPLFFRVTQAAGRVPIWQQMIALNKQIEGCLCPSNDSLQTKIWARNRWPQAMEDDF